MKLLKYLLGGILSAFALSTQAQVSTLVSATSAGVTNSVLAAPGRLYSVTFNGTGNFWVYDASAAAGITRITPAYTNITSFTTNVVTSVTNYYGSTYSMTNTAIELLTNTVARATNSAPVIYAAGMTSSAQDTSFIPARYANFGLTVVTTNAGTITVTYSR